MRAHVPITKSTAESPEHRERPRLKLPPMYTLVRVRPAGHDRFCWTGHIYDISEQGMRFEVDHPIEPGTAIDVRAMLPGATPITFTATGTVVRLHDDRDEPGPTRMGMIFDTFTRDTDQQRLADYVTTTQLNAA